MKISLLELKNFESHSGCSMGVVACVPEGLPNYTGRATIHPMTPDGTIVAPVEAIDRANLFPVSMVRQAISDGSFYLEGGDWMVCSRPKGADYAYNYYSFHLEPDDSDLASTYIQAGLQLVEVQCYVTPTGLAKVYRAIKRDRVDAETGVIFAVSED